MTVSSSVPSSQAVSDMSFEEALAELELVVRRLEEGRQPLEEAMTSYERGAALKARCEALLEEAQLKVEKIMNTQKGEVTLEPFETQEGG